MQSVDVVIIGGGMVGLALAAALKESDLRIAVVENQLPEEALNPLPDVRVSALSRSSEIVLRNLNAWAALKRAALRPTSRWKCGSKIVLRGLNLKPMR